MGFLTARILKVLQMGQIIGADLDLPEKFLPAPGQYLPVQHLEDEGEILTQPLFRVIGPANQNYLGPIPTHWQPGDWISLLPPQGNGFRLPRYTRRVGLLFLNAQPTGSLALIQPALEQNAAVVLFVQETLPPGLLDWIPASVEISPLSQLKENLDWPDFFVTEIARENLKVLNSLFGEVTPVFSGQVLVTTAMPCRGIGGCGVCAVKTKHGWRNACTDGPVFPLEELLHVAG